MTALIAGCGDLGTQIGLLFADQGWDVHGIRRSPEKLPETINGIRADLGTQVPAVPPETEIVVMATAADERTEHAYRQAYLDALRNLLHGIRTSGAWPRRMLLISSTSVYGPQEGVVDEETPAHPATATGAILLQAEKLLRDQMPRATVLRLSGLYGPGRTRLIDQVRAGIAADRPDRYTNRIHRDDAAAATVHLTTRVDEPAPLYLGTDDEPAPRSAVLAFLAQQLDVPAPQTAVDTVTPPGGRRCSNARLTATGFRLRYPSFREGYEAVLAETGSRHP